jgi:hypothetical protein
MYSVAKQVGAASAAASMPSYADWLKPLSLTRPTSVTRPTFSWVSHVIVAADGSTDADAEGASEGATDGAVEGATDGAVLAAPGPHAATIMARPANRVRPKRFCM